MRQGERHDGWDASADGRLCLSSDDDDEDCATTLTDAQAITTIPVRTGYQTTSSRETSASSTWSVTTTPVTTPSTTLPATTTTDAPRPLSIPAGQVIYQVDGTTQALLHATRAASSSATYTAVQSAPDFMNPVSMNIGLIVGVAVAIAVLLCMLAYVVYKCIVAGQRPSMTRGGVDYAEKTALGVGHDVSPPHRHHYASQFAVNGRPPPLLTNDSRTKKDVKEWYV